MTGVTYLEGERVRLRTVEDDDVPFLQELLVDRDCWEGFGAPGPRSERRVRASHERRADADDEMSWLVVAEGDRVGRIRLVDIDRSWGTAELVATVAPGHRGEGYATDAARLVTDHAADYLRLHRVAARVFATNDAGQRVLEKAGFEHEGREREAAYHAGDYRDVLVYGLLVGRE